MAHPYFQNFSFSLPHSLNQRWVAFHLVGNSVVSDAETYICLILIWLRAQFVPGQELLDTFLAYRMMSNKMKNVSKGLWLMFKSSNILWKKQISTVRLQLRIASNLSLCWNLLFLILSGNKWDKTAINMRITYLQLSFFSCHLSCYCMNSKDQRSWFKWIKLSCENTY